MQSPLEKSEVDLRTAGTTPDKLEDDNEVDKVIAMSKWIAGTWKGRGMYWVLRILMLIESIVWTMMDIIRSLRTKWAQKIHNQHNKTIK